MFLNQTKKWFVGAGVFICLYILSGCNHLYYHPDDKIYVNPDRPFWGGRPLTIKLKNEVVLDGLYIPKKNQAPCQNKILIHFHGNAQNLTAHFPLLEWVKNIGVDYYTFDYPGYGKSTGEANQKSLASASSELIEIILNGDRPEFKDKQIIFYGQSLGGAVMSHALASLTNPNHVKRIHKVVLESSFASYREVANRKLSLSWLTWSLQWIPYVFVSDEAPLKSKMKTGVFPEVLVVHSKQDWIVPYGSGEDLFNAWRQPKQFWSYLGFSHLQLNAFSDFRSRLTKFICK